MYGFPAEFWRWIKALGAPSQRGSRRLRRARSNPFFNVAAQIEELESRQLPTVTFHGGALLANVEAQPVYFGSDWKATAALSAQAGQLGQFVSTIVNSPYMDMLSNAGYHVGRGAFSAGVAADIALNKTSGVTDAQIQGEIQAMIKAGQLQAPDANRLYIVYVEPGVVVRLGSSASNTSFLGYHGAFAGTTAAGIAADIHYAVIAFPGAPNFTASSQGFSSNFNEMTSVTSHELAEAVTDPNVNYKALGWYDDQNNGEIGDLAEGHYAQLAGPNGTSFQVQDVVNQSDQVISPASTPTPTPPATLSAPQNVSLTALSTTTAQLSWGAVAGTQGYRVFQVNGSQSVLLGTLSASTTSVQITGLTPGARESFKVEAFSGTATADSQVVSVTMPASQPQHLTAPQVSAAALSSTTVSLTWNSVAGAQGYRIYWWNGYQSVLLGTVGSSTTAAQISGLSPGMRSYFLVEAFSGSSVADSSWVSVVTPYASAHNNSHAG
ncbi:MAG TPA: fibronectin type III domain-containing protein [Planctomycetaceae bacterium]|nr:fibronectin type III domain-containing protein [Planctomycetaceae bacterium]